MKKKVLDVRMPIEEQKKLIPHLKTKKYKVDVDVGKGRIRYIYGDDPVTLEMFALCEGWTIIKTTEL